MKNNSLEQFMQKFSSRVDLTNLHHMEEIIKKEITIIPDRIDHSTFSIKYEEIKNHIKNIEIEWDNKPIEFLQRDHVHKYIDEFLEKIGLIDNFKNKVSESYINDLRIRFSEKGMIIYLMVCYFISAIIIAFCMGAFFHASSNDSNKILVVIIAVVISIVMTGNRNKRRFKKYDISSSKEHQSGLEGLDQKIIKIKNRVEVGASEMFANADFNQSLLNQIKSRQIDAHFNEQQSKQLLLDRMEIMKLEIEKAREMAKDMAEQHRITEEMRIKYAREMMELEQQLKAQSDRDLYEKMEALRKMMEG